MKVNPDARSDTCCWTVADWALEAAAARGKSTAHVRAYMREKWGQCPSLAMSYSKKKGISAKGSPEVENAASVGAAGAGSRAETSVSVPAAPLPAQPLREASAVHAKPQGNGWGGGIVYQEDGLGTAATGAAQSRNSIPARCPSCGVTALMVDSSYCHRCGERLSAFLGPAVVISFQHLSSKRFGTSCEASSTGYFER